jgi:3-phenylpropionate/trans-cinnamate dioxygenase ferredoxin reductase subunit
MSSDRPFVIVGGGLAGAKAAETLRDEGFDGRVVLLAEEPESPYERPGLSKGYLRGESPQEKLLVHPEAFYAEHDIELRTSTGATSLDLGASEVELAGGERLGYERLLLATGAAPRRLNIPGSDLAGVHYLRDVGDADSLRTALQGASRIAVIGAGWIGAEVAGSARELGVDVTMIAPESVPLERVLGEEMGAVYRDVHADHGVDLRLGSGIASFEGDERVSAVRLADGATIDCEVVLVGIGVAPRVELAESAGLQIDNGLPVDERLESAAPGVFAAGDIANAEHPFYGRRIRVEHWDNAGEQGKAAARNMLGRGEAYDRIPYFFSDQYDVGMEYAGHALSWDRIVVRGDVASREFVAFWVEGEAVVAGMNVNIWDVNDDIQSLIRSRARVDVSRLQDPDVPLAELAAAAAPGGK